MTKIQPTGEDAHKKSLILFCENCNNQHPSSKLQGSPGDVQKKEGGEDFIFAKNFFSIKTNFLRMDQEKDLGNKAHSKIQFELST